MEPFRLPPAPTRPTGTAPDHPSPTKRRKVAPPPPTSLDATLSSSSLLAFALPPTSHPEQEPPLAHVPAPLALVALAVSLRTSAQALLPALAKRPSSTSTTSQQRYAHAWAHYHRAATAAILALRAAVHLTASASDYAGGRLELRACAMLAQALVDLYDGSGSEHVVAPEADRALSRAIAISQSHPSLAAYAPALSLLHLRLSLFSHKPLKFIRTTLRRLVQSLPPLSAAVRTPSAGASSSPAHLQPGSRPPPAASAATAAATYAAHALTASIPGATPLEALSAWDTVRELARDRGDDEVRVVAALAGARLALEAEDYARCGALLGELRGAFDPAEGEGEGAGEAQREGAHGPPPPTRPRLLDVQYRLVACLYHFQVGDAKLAKETLKRAHALLDAVPAAGAGADAALGGGEGGEVAVIVNAAPGSTDSPATLRFQVPAQATLYPFAFLASAAIHLDPQGKTPRAQLFGEEGVRITEQRLNGREVTLPVPSLGSISTSLTRAAALRSRLYLLLSSLSILRSEYPAAHAHLAHALGIASAYAPASAHDSGDGAGAHWADEVHLRAALAWALLRCARAARDGADEREAERALEAVLDAASSASSSGAGAARTSASPQMAHLVTVARLSLVLLRMSAPPGALAPSPVTSTDALVRALAASSSSMSSTSAASSSSSHARLAAALATAITARSITASKAALSQALSLTNQMGATHARAGVLALLGNVFLWTREGEAQRMLSSALRLASSFGSPTTRTVDGVPVGHARLSLWLGQRLADTYRANPQSSPEHVAAQERANAACRNMVAREALEAQQEEAQQTAGNGARDVEMREA